MGRPFSENWRKQTRSYPSKGLRQRSRFGGPNRVAHRLAACLRWTRFSRPIRPVLPGRRVIRYPRSFYCRSGDGVHEANVRVGSRAAVKLTRLPRTVCREGIVHSAWCMVRGGRPRCRMHGCAPGAGGPEGERNGNYRHDAHAASGDGDLAREVSAPRSAAGCGRMSGTLAALLAARWVRPAGALFLKCTNVCTPILHTRRQRTEEGLSRRTCGFGRWRSGEGGQRTSECRGLRANVRHACGAVGGTVGSACRCIVSEVHQCLHTDPAHPPPTN